MGLPLGGTALREGHPRVNRIWPKDRTHQLRPFPAARVRAPKYSARRRTLGMSGVAMGRLHPADVHVGTRLRHRRTLLAMTQALLGDAVHLTFRRGGRYAVRRRQGSPDQARDARTGARLLQDRPPRRAPAPPRDGPGDGASQPRRDARRRQDAKEGAPLKCRGTPRRGRDRVAPKTWLHPSPCLRGRRGSRAGRSLPE